MTLTKLRLVALAGLFALVASSVSAISMGEMCLTPTVDILPVHHFRIDFGLLAATNVRSLLDGRKGDVVGPYLSIAYGASENGVLTVEGMPYKRFEGDDGRGSEGVGDFSVWGKFILERFGDATAYGVRFGAKLPNTPSNKDFGTNQTDFFMHVFGGTDVGTWQMSAYSGIGILERPAGEEAQDDVFMVGVLGRHGVGAGRLSVEAEGFTKSRIYGDNWALYGQIEWPASDTIGVVFGAQLSKGRLYGDGEIRVGLVWGLY